MNVRDHLSQHETAEELPLITESATVVEISAMDHNRNHEVIAAIMETLNNYGTEAWHAEKPSDDEASRRWIRDQLDFDDENREEPFNQYLQEAKREGTVGKKLSALQQRYRRPYPSLLRLRVETDDPIDFVPGQYLSIRYQDITRPYSVASSPNRDDIEFCIRRVPGGDLTPELSVELSEGDTVTLRGPYGEFVMEDPSERDMVFLATGTGVAPFKSMIEYVFEEARDVHEGKTRDVWLFLGCGWEDDLPYREEFRALANNQANFHFVPTLSREAYLSDWTGEMAYVQSTLVKYLADEALSDVDLDPEFEPYQTEEPRYPIEAQLKPASMEVYACGINAMVYDLVDAVARLGVDEEHTQFEGFG